MGHQHFWRLVIPFVSRYLCCIVTTSICRDGTIVVAVVLLQRLQVLRTFRWGNRAPVLDASHNISLAHLLGISCNSSSTFMQNTRLDIFPGPHFSLQSPNELAYLRQLFEFLQNKIDSPVPCTFLRAIARLSQLVPGEKWKILSL